MRVLPHVRDEGVPSALHEEQPRVNPPTPGPVGALGRPCWLPSTPWAAERLLVRYVQLVGWHRLPGTWPPDPSLSVGLIPMLLWSALVVSSGIGGHDVSTAGDLLLTMSIPGRNSTAAMLVRAGFFVVLALVNVSGFWPVMARGRHGVRRSRLPGTSCWSGATISLGTG